MDSVECESYQGASTLSPQGNLLFSIAQRDEVHENAQFSVVAQSQRRTTVRVPIAEAGRPEGLIGSPWVL